MRWLFATLGLLLASGCLVGWIYLRDRDTSWRPGEEQMVIADAYGAISELGGGTCLSGCDPERLGRAPSHLWFVHVRLMGKSKCLEINVKRFSMTAAHGLSGVQESSCTIR